MFAISFNAGNLALEKLKLKLFLTTTRVLFFEGFFIFVVVLNWLKIRTRTQRFHNMCITIKSIMFDVDALFTFTYVILWK